MARRDSERARRLLAGFKGTLDDASRHEELDDAVERAVDALLADNQHVPALLMLCQALMLHAQVDGWQYHPRPLQDARRFLLYARELAPADPQVLEALLRCELLLRRFESAAFLMDEAREQRGLAFVAALGRAISLDMQEKPKLADAAYAEAGQLTDEASARCGALVLQARCLVSAGDLPRADAVMAQAVLTGRPHRQRLQYWSRLKFLRKRYDEAWELNRRALTFGEFEEAMWARQEMLVFFRRLSFTPRPPFSLPEETAAGIDGVARFTGGRLVNGDAVPAAATPDDEEDFIPAFRVNLFLEGDHLPVVSDIADPSASFEGRARLTVRYVDPRTLEKQPLTPGARFRSGQYMFIDERAGIVYHALIVRRADRQNPFRDLPEADGAFFSLDKAALEKIDRAPFDVRLYVAEHGYDPLMGQLNFCKLVDSFVRHGQGIGVDMETGRAIAGGDWRNEGPQSFEVSKHVQIHAQEQEPGRFWLHTHGLCKFLRPEIEVYDIPLALLDLARRELLLAADEAARGAIVREGDLVGTLSQPLLVRRGRKRPEDDGQHNLRLRVELVDVDANQEPLAGGAARGLQALGKSRAG